MDTYGAFVPRLVNGLVHPSFLSGLTLLIPMGFVTHEPWDEAPSRPPCPGEAALSEARRFHAQPGMKMEKINEYSRENDMYKDPHRIIYTLNKSYVTILYNHIYIYVSTCG